MFRRRLYCCLLYCSLVTCKIFAQDSVVGKDKKLVAKGFFTGLGYLRFTGTMDQAYFTQLLHNRINLDAKLGNTLNWRMDIRNRIYHGEDVRSVPDVSVFLRNSNEGVNLQKTWFSSHSWVMHSNIDRLYIDHTTGKWKLRAGRQRINWGITTLWNPNDVFNAYNFLDFDYEERPGVDALTVTRTAADLSEFDFAIAKLGGKQHSLAARYFFNRGGYDMQFNLGSYRKRMSGGFGWAGGIGNYGFKGEMQYFLRDKSLPGIFNASIEFDRLLNKQWYLVYGCMFNSLGRAHAVDDPMEISFTATPEQMMPGKWNFSFLFNKEWSPLFSGSLTLVYAPGIDLLLLVPRTSYGLTEDIALDLLVQTYFLHYNQRFASWQHILFCRIKYNF